jgi:hypothetical protein
MSARTRHNAQQLACKSDSMVAFFKMMIKRFQECRVAKLREIDQRCALLRL